MSKSKPYEVQSHGASNDFKKHRTLVLDYNKLAQTFNKNNLLGSIELIVTLGLLYFISVANIPFSKLLACFFILLAVFFMAKDYGRSKNLDIKIVQLVMEGVNLERESPSFDQVFHNILRKFSVVKILVSRSICIVLCVCCISFFMRKIFLEELFSADKHKVLMGLAGCTIATIACLLYYQPYKEFESLRNNLIAQEKG